MSLFGPLLSPLMRGIAMNQPGRLEARYRVVSFVTTATNADWDRAAEAVDAAAPSGEEVMFDTLEGMAAVAGDAIHAMLTQGPPPFVTAVRPC